MANGQKRSPCFIKGSPSRIRGKSESILSENIDVLSGRRSHIEWEMIYRQRASNEERRMMAQLLERNVAWEDENPLPISSEYAERMAWQSMEVGDIYRAERFAQRHPTPALIRRKYGIPFIQ